MTSPAATDSILVVDDDRSIRHVLEQTLSADGFHVIVASNVAECVSRIENDSPRLVLLDVNLPDGNGIDVLKRVRNLDDRPPIVLITAAGDSHTAISASRFGAQDYLTKPLDLRRLREVVVRALRTQPSGEGQESASREIVPIASTDPFIGRSRLMQEVFKSIGRVAKQPVSVLIRGESGTGKELVARAIWQHSDRAGKAFTAVNCAALSNELLESELFGHEKGAFTGADRRHIGKFEASNGGTLFLDEVGDMHAAMQAKLLRVLQERSFTRVGGQDMVTTNVRILSATNRDLEGMCFQGTFREDLFHRLNGFSIHVPPLRDRGDDVRLLLGQLLHRYNQRLNKRIHAISPGAAETLEHYPWPGNVRELESVLGQIMLNAQGGIIDVSDLPSYMMQQSETCEQDSIALDPDPMPSGQGQFETLVTRLIRSTSTDIYAQTVEFVERYLLGRVLEATDGNQSAAARRLGITRGSLRFKLKQLSISIDNAVRVPKPEYEKPKPTSRSTRGRSTPT